MDEMVVSENVILMVTIQSRLVGNYRLFRMCQGDENLLGIMFLIIAVR